MSERFPEALIDRDSATSACNGCSCASKLTHAHARRTRVPTLASVSANATTIYIRLGVSRISQPL